MPKPDLCGSQGFLGVPRFSQMPTFSDLWAKGDFLAAISQDFFPDLRLFPQGAKSKAPLREGGVLGEPFSPPVSTRIPLGFHRFPPTPKKPISTGFHHYSPPHFITI
jgi:hypothetical protein